MTADPDVEEPDPRSTAWWEAVDRIFAALGDASLTYNLSALLTMSSVERGSRSAPTTTCRSRLTPSRRAVETALARGAHVTVAPWERTRPNERPEVDWIRHVTSMGSHHLGVVVPASSLSGSRVKALWQALPDHVRPVAIMTGTRWFPFIHSQFETALVVLGPHGRRTAPHVPDPQQVPADQWLGDLEQLWRQQGGRTQFGYVLCEHRPRGRAAELRASRPRSSRPGGRFVELRRDARALRAIRRAAQSLASPGRRPEPTQRRRDRCGRGPGHWSGGHAGLGARPGGTHRGTFGLVELRDGDVVLGGAVARTGTSGYRCAVVRPEHLPAVAGGSVLVLRPLEAVDPGAREFILDYLRSPLARQVLAISRRAHVYRSAADLRTLRVPIPDPPLAAALADLASAASDLKAGTTRRPRFCEDSSRTRRR